MLSETQDMDAAQRFFHQAQIVARQLPERVMTDGHPSYPRAIRETLGEAVAHRSSQYLNNRRSKTTAVSSSGITRCVGSRVLIQPVASVEHSTSSASSSSIGGCE
jgi:hypothetical protein